MASNPWSILAQARAETARLPELYGQMKRQRLEDLYRQKQFEAEDRKAAAEDRRMGVMSRLFVQGDPPAPPASQPVNSVPEPAPVTQSERPDAASIPSGSPLSPETIPDAPVSTMPVGLTPDQPLPPRTDGLVINQDALRELYAIDPKGAMEIQKSVYESNRQQLEQATQRGEAMAAAATAIAQLPFDQRAGEFQRWVGYLVERGFPQEMLGQVDLSDAGLSRYYSQGRTLEKLIEGRKDERDSALAREKFEEDLRHNRATEGVAQQGLGVRQDALKIARQRAANGDGGDISALSNDALIAAAMGR